MKTKATISRFGRNIVSWNLNREPKIKATSHSNPPNRFPIAIIPIKTIESIATNPTRINIVTLVIHTQVAPKMKSTITIVKRGKNRCFKIGLSNISSLRCSCATLAGMSS